MIDGIEPVWQTCLGTLLTWGLTALGAALVFVLQGGERKVLDSSLGFAAGVMLAASYWSLLAPAIELAEQSGVYGSFTFVPVGIGFLAGAWFVWIADKLLNTLGIGDTFLVDSLTRKDKLEEGLESENNVPVPTPHGSPPDWTSSNIRRRGQLKESEEETDPLSSDTDKTASRQSWKRILLLIIAITVHNIPEGLAVGVGFGAIGKVPSATLENARNLALGIGIQNFPEGLAVSLPLRAAGMSKLKSFWYGQLSGMVEPLAGIFGTLAIIVAEPLLPYALAFAAGAMVYVVVDDLIPESHTSGNGRLSSFGVVIGFLVMMSLDVGLG